ncbi:MAG: hypothetical protein AAGJ18_09095 [Bacteroidota bacterium]
MIKIAQLVFLFLFPLGVYAQTIDLNRTVTFRYKNQKLGYILSDISRKYSIPFSYSSNFIPVDKRMTIVERKVSLKSGLDKLFAPTQIIYAIIGNSIALKIDESKAVISVIEPAINRNRNIESEELPMLQRYSYPLLVWKHPIPVEVLAEMKATRSVVEEVDFPDELVEGNLNEAMFQATLVPPISTHEEKSEQISNTFSLNVLWGKNGGVDGIEVGGLLNMLVQDMQGFQLSGVGNIVEGDAQGVQLAGTFNYNKGFTKGVQASLLNIASAANVIQLGSINIIEEGFEGVQAAILGNYTHKKANGWQVAGLLNYTKGTANTQIALGINKADEIDNLQIGLVNIAGYTKGRQIGLINVVEQSEYAPIGLVNVVKDGYNRLEVSAGDALYTNVGLKLGTRRFYNIFQFGHRLTEEIWSLGYGVGTSFSIKERQYFQLEWVASHINEGKVWTNNLNLLNQVRFIFNWTLNGKKGLFFGPNLNILASKLTDPETLAVVGSSLPTYTFVDTNLASTNWKMWVGASAGFRF